MRVYAAVLILPFFASTSCRSDDIKRPVIVVSVNEVGAVAAQYAAQLSNRNAKPGDSILISTQTPYPTKPDQAIQFAASTVNNKDVIAFVGFMDSGTSVATARLFNEAGLVQVAPTVTATAYTDAGRWSFSMSPGDDEQARFIARVIRNDSSVRRVALLYENDEYGRNLAAGIVRELGQHAHPSFIGSYTANDTLIIQHLAERLDTSSAELLVWAGRIPELQILLARVHRTWPVLGTDALEGALIADRRALLRNVRFAAAADPHRDEPVVAELERRLGRTVTADAALTFDAVTLLARAVQSGSSSRASVRAYLESIGRTRPPFTGMGGATDFSARRHPKRSFFLKKVCDSVCS